MAGENFYYDARTGTMAPYAAAPDPGNWYRLIPTPNPYGFHPQARDVLQQGEYPLFVPPDFRDQASPLMNRQYSDMLESLRRYQYEDPGWIFESHPEWAPQAPSRPAYPPSSQAPPWRPFDNRAADIVNDQDPNAPVPWFKGAPAHQAQER